MNHSSRHLLRVKNGIIAGSVVLLTVLFLACDSGRKSREKAPQVTLETAQLVSHVTSGAISTGDRIRVRFVSPVVSGDVKPPEGIFEFQPSIEGDSEWEDEQTLVFIPKKPLALGTSFEGKLNLKKLFPDAGSAVSEPLVLQFEVAGREVASLTGDFHLKNENDPKYLIYKGGMVLTEPVDLKAVAEAVALTVQANKIALSWKEGTAGTYMFESQVIRRADFDQKCQFVVRKEPIRLFQEIRKSFVLPMLTEMKVMEIRVKGGETEKSLIVVFSDEVDTRKDITGLISVDPALSVRSHILGKEVHLTGPFAYGQAYAVNVHPGIRSVWGTSIKKASVHNVQFEDLKPLIRFSSNGVFLPSANQQKIRFQSLNLRRVRLNVKQVFESNIGQFLQEENLSNSQNRYEYWDTYNLQRVGVDVADDTLDIGLEKNKWLQHEIDLKKIVQPGGGLYILTLSFEHEDMIYGPEEEREGTRDYYYGEDYYTNPLSNGYIYRFGRIMKPIILSDIGILYKRGIKNHRIFTTDILTGTPLSGVTVTLRTFQNQVIDRKKTDGQGVAEFADIEKEVFYVEAAKENQRSVIKTNEMSWNVSAFETGGRTGQEEGIRTFFYTERDVYRPGDGIHMVLIVRSGSSFPEGHPVSMKIYNPRNQMVYETVVKEAVDGVYPFFYETIPEDPTGNWHAEFLVGSYKVSHLLKIETVVPYRLKVELKPGKEAMDWRDRTLALHFSSSYLFGNPSAGLQAQVEATLERAVKTYTGYKEFVFDDEALEYQPEMNIIYEGQLDDNGTADLEWEKPFMEALPSALTAVFQATVFEKGGRPNRYSVQIPVENFSRFVGLKKMDGEYSAIQVGSALKIPVILIDVNGRPVSGQSLSYRIYRNQDYWWWEYEDHAQFRLRFRNDSNTELVGEGTLTTLNRPVDLEFTPEERGDYLIEVTDMMERGHQASIFMQAYAWGETPGEADAADLLTLRADKEVYHPGDVAQIEFSTPGQGIILLTLETSRVLESKWIKPKQDEKKISIPVPITGSMMPNVYTTVTVVQPFENMNDRPLRMYGVIPLKVEDPSTRQEIRISTEDIIRPGKSFKVQIETLDRKPTQYTVAVVDEGLLSLTAYETPDPWAAFYSKTRLGVESFDLFSEVIGANKGDVFRTFSIGGGMALAEAMRKMQLGSEVMRFASVSLFQGPFMTDEKGRSELTFEMPNYTGAVRIMAVCANGMRFGSAEKIVQVKEDLVLSASLPRVLGPGDRSDVPVSVFAGKDGMGVVDVTLEVQGPVQVIGASKQSVSFDTKGEKEILFAVQAKKETGTAKIRFEAKGGSKTVWDETELAVRASSPRIFTTEQKEILPDKTVVFRVPDRGIPGSNRASITLQRRPDLNFNHRLGWLMGYPYGCIEQTVSAVFPQLFLMKILRTESGIGDADRNINRAIERLRKFQLSSGGMSYWPGEGQPSSWGTNYAGHLLIEASKLGYHVPDDMMNGWLRYQSSQALTSRDPMMVRVYRLYLLALAGKPEIGAMNLTRESSGDMEDVERWLLAGAYRLAGVTSTAARLEAESGLNVREYTEFSNTYGSGYRDKAILLEMMVLFEKWGEARSLAKEIAEILSSDTWYSTQTVGYMLLAMGKYLQATEGEEVPVMKGVVVFPDGTQKTFDTRDASVSYEIDKGFGGQIRITLEATTVERAWTTLEWSGVPLEDEGGDISKRLLLDVSWLDEDGNSLDPYRLPQGATFWGHFRVSRDASVLHAVEELALVQALPAGWEIENIRLSDEGFPDWMSGWTLNRESYLDIRDDRIMWFFDLPFEKEPLDFVVKLNTVTRGDYLLPPSWLEAMYNHEYQAKKRGGRVTVTGR